MKDIKKLMITLVALLAVTTGAWAQTVTVKELTASEITAWANDATNITAADLPGFVEATTEQAQSWDGYPTNGFVYLIYGFDNGEMKKINYNSGNAMTPSQAPKTRAGVYNDMNRSTPDRYFYVTGIEGGLVVDWNKTSKTGTFKMPGGNVELEPEYYPQAALTAEPTAINDVPATTDGAIVNAGTVATIDGTTTAQGTVMYYVSTTALDDAALLALDADAWTADVPTAQSFTAAGTAYVYYYVRGNDSDNDDEIFSDGDILSVNALTVNIAAAPTYAVTFAEGLAEPDKWTADPNADVTKGETVTVTYTGAKKILGVKAEKKAAAAGIVNPVVGQVIGSDGKNYDANATLPTGVTAVAKICYVGSETGVEGYTHGLALALTDEASTMNWTTATGASGAAAHTPAAPTTTSSWMLPSKDQWEKMITAAGGYTALGDGFSGISGASNMQSETYYWSSTEYDAGKAWDFKCIEGTWYVSDKSYDDQVRACLAF